MELLHLSQAAVYHLQQLSIKVKQRTGVRHQLSNPRSVINLLRFSCTTPDSAIYEAFATFSEHLSDKQRNYLQERGLLIPPRAFTSADTPEQRKPLLQRF